MVNVILTDNSVTTGLDAVNEMIASEVTNTINENNGCFDFTKKSEITKAAQALLDYFEIVIGVQIEQGKIVTEFNRQLINIA